MSDEAVCFWVLETPDDVSLSVTMVSGKRLRIKRSALEPQPGTQRRKIVDGILVDREMRGDFRLTTQTSNFLVIGGRLSINGRDIGEIQEIVPVKRSPVNQHPLRDRGRR